MKRIKYFLFFCLMIMVIVYSSCSHKDTSLSNPTQPDSTKTTTTNSDNHDSVFTIANWNIEWFGSTDEGVPNLDLQQANVLKVIRYLKPDIIGFAEVVDIARFRAIVDSLGHNYNFQVSQFGSGATSINSSDYADDQKLAFIYDSTKVRIRNVGPYLASSSTASYNFASGRFPYMLNADITMNGITKNVTFFMIHAKSGADETSYGRRVAASAEFKDSLDAEGLNKKYMMILGDFNDELQGSITYGKTVSPYQNFVQDNNYVGITLPLQQPDSASMIDEPSVIDHQISSSIFDKMYLQGSVKIRTDVINIIPDYKQNTTSDHYPITSEFIFDRARVGN